MDDADLTANLTGDLTPDLIEAARRLFAGPVEFLKSAPGLETAMICLTTQTPTLAKPVSFTHS